MAKWADYCITAVRFNDKRTHIDMVRAFEDKGEKLGASGDYSRAQVVAAIKEGTEFITIFKGDDGKWSKGQKVFIIKVNETEYIKTVDNGKAVDNLDNLPEF